MKRTYKLLIVLFVESFNVNAQISVYDTTNKFYKGIDFSFKDDLSYWTYKIHLKNSTKKDPTIGTIVFWRTEKWDDNTDKEFHMAWNPSISFEIYDLKDSALAFDRSQSTRALAFCKVPEIGGDLFVIGNYIFVNGESCVSGYRRKNNTEYCRPTINRLFKNLDLSKISTVREIVDQIPIKETK